MDTTKHTRYSKTAVLRARCEPQLAESVVAIARRHRIDASDVVRIACEMYVRGAGSTAPLLPLFGQ